MILSDIHNLDTDWNVCCVDQVLTTHSLLASSLKNMFQKERKEKKKRNNFQRRVWSICNMITSTYRYGECQHFYVTLKIFSSIHDLLQIFSAKIHTFKLTVLLKVTLYHMENQTEQDNYINYNWKNMYNRLLHKRNMYQCC